MKRLLVFSISLFCCVLGTAQPVLAQPKYSYAFWSGDGVSQTQLVYVDPEQIDIPTRINPFLPVDKPEELSLAAYRASPDGKWIVILMYSRIAHLNTVILMNVESGEVREISDGHLSSDANLMLFIGTPVYLAWSPNSRYVALNMKRDDIYHIYIYEAATGNLINLTKEDLRSHFHIAWSHDSQSLITTSDFCREDTYIVCDSRLQIYDIPSQKLKVEKDITSLAGRSTQLGTVGCNFDWSPDGNFIKFVSVCSLIAVPSVTPEIYLWNLVKDNIYPITNSKTALTNLPDKVGVLGSYATAWYGNNKLLISAMYNDSSGLGIRRIKTSLYDTETQTDVIWADSDTSYWSINPVANDIAYVSGLLNEDKQTKFAIVIGQLATDTKQFTMKQMIDRSADTPPLRPCNLSWSPDGQWLVFLSRPKGCGSQTQYIGFVDREGHIVEYPITDKDQLGIDSVWPVGWVMR